MIQDSLQQLFLKTSLHMDIFLQDANNGTDCQFDYCQSFLTVCQMDSFNYTSSQNYQNFNQAGTDLHFIQDFCKDPEYNRFEIQNQDENKENQQVETLSKKQSRFCQKSFTQTQTINSQTQPLSNSIHQDQSALNSMESKQTSNSSKTKKIKSHFRQAYPTKNFLPTFRPFFLNYLQQYFSDQKFNKIEIIQRIKSKKCINLRDYQDLLAHPLFRVHLKVYFACGQIFKDLMQCRIEMKVKIQYFKRINVFEKAFKSKHFPKIN